MCHETQEISRNLTFEIVAQVKIHLQLSRLFYLLVTRFMRHGVSSSQAPIFAQSTTSSKTAHSFDLGQALVYRDKKNGKIHLQRQPRPVLYEVLLIP